jgi:hypothetical protein
MPGRASLTRRARNAILLPLVTACPRAAARPPRRLRGNPLDPRPVPVGRTDAAAASPPPGTATARHDSIAPFRRSRARATRSPRTMTMIRMNVAALACCLLATPAAFAQETAPDAPDAPDAPAAPTTPAADLPSVEEVLEKALDAMGGRKALEAIESTSMTGSMSTPMGDMQLVMKSAKGNRFLIKQTMAGMGDITMGSDGEVGWMNHPMMGGASLLEAEQVEEMRGQAHMYGMVMRLEEDYVTKEVVDKTDFRGAECYKVHVIDEDKQEEDIYFNAESGFIAGFESSQDQGMGPQQIVIGFEDWKEFGDIKGFTKMVIEQMGMTMEMTITEVELNNVDPSAFDLPDDVKALVAGEGDAPASQPDEG